MTSVWYLVLVWYYGQVTLPEESYRQCEDNRKFVMTQESKNRGAASLVSAYCLKGAK